MDKVNFIISLISIFTKKLCFAVSSHLLQFQTVLKCLTAFESQINLSLTGPSGAFRLQSVNGVENCLMVLRIWWGESTMA